MGEPRPRPDRPRPTGPIRTCIGCRRRRPQPELLRLVRTDVGTYAIGRTLPGRGAWLCRDDPGCFDEAVRRGGLARAFRLRPDPVAVETLRAALGDRDGI